MTPDGKASLITGGGSGTGLGLAAALDGASHKVIIAAVGDLRWTRPRRFIPGPR